MAKKSITILAFFIFKNESKITKLVVLVATIPSKFDHPVALCDGWAMTESYLDLRKRNLFGQDRKRIMISIVNQALQTHSTKKKAWWALVWYLSKVQAVVLKEVHTVIFFITGTLISGWVLRQKETIDTTMKNTEITPITWKKNW